MRITQTLCKQHIYQMFKRHWKIQGVIVPNDIGSQESCNENGIKYDDPLQRSKKKMNNYIPKANRPYREVVMPRDETHPLWNSRPCFIYGDSNVLVNGLDQAQILTKSQMYNTLPKRIQDTVQNTEIPPESDKYLKNATLAAYLFDAEQEKLPKIKDPLRPAWVFYRVYNITNQRKCRLIIAKMLLECEKLAGLQVSSDRNIYNNRRFVVPFEKENNLYQFDIHADTFVSSKYAVTANNLDEGLSPVSLELPDIYPMTCNVSITKENIYNIEKMYPLLNDSPFAHPHTIFLHLSPHDVRNIYEKTVTEDQEHARSLIQAFTVAAAKAQAKFGDDVKQLPEPIVVQVVQVGISKFRFGVFQLNTLDLNGTDGVRNYWFSAPKMDLYSECMYEDSRPILRDFNPEVFKHILAFYKNN